MALTQLSVSVKPLIILKPHKTRKPRYQAYATLLPIGSYDWIREQCCVR
jgi:hypothetical protein